MGSHKTEQKTSIVLCATMYKCDRTRHKVSSGSARPEVPTRSLLLYVNLATHRVSTSASVVIAQQKKLQQEGPG